MDLDIHIHHDIYRYLKAPPLNEYQLLYQVGLRVGWCLKLKLIFPRHPLRHLKVLKGAALNASTSRSIRSIPGHVRLGVCTI